ncbi:DUF559 domain-containing protein [Polymorphospora rubra]|uniref:DUF559 domain-containing protein n=1 Tax=Polymorphospora rubra TaxID=338584 RepID=A0A810MYH7_9ACTN|nr:DUF559 domain-containing protein [Polymorphospora rubra]BCJ64428.1 hypothetical protein Prubr_14490 [Polymorphospora rubra]
MPRTARVPRELAFLPFLGSRAVAEGLLTRRMLEGRSWYRLLPDVYVHAGGYQPDDHRMWCDAVALTLPPGAAICGLSAAYLWGVRLLDRQSPVSVVLPGTYRPRRQERVVVSYYRLPASDVTRFADLSVTTPARTAFDLGRLMPRVEAVVAVDALLARRLVRLDTLAGYLAAHPPCPGIRQLRQVLAIAEPLSESPMETRLRLVLVDGGAPRPAAQFEVHDSQGRFVGRVDLAYPQWRIAIEYEGDHHREQARFRRDVARLNDLRACGWLVLRFTADDVLRHPDRVIALVFRAIAERRQSAQATRSPS